MIRAAPSVLITVAEPLAVTFFLGGDYKTGLTCSFGIRQIAQLQQTRCL